MLDAPASGFFGLSGFARFVGFFLFSWLLGFVRFLGVLEFRALQGLRDGADCKSLRTQP